MPKKLTPQTLAELRHNPFVRIKLENIRLRAYYHWLNRSGFRWNDSQSNWIQAEQEEMLSQITQKLVFPFDAEYNPNSQFDFDEEYRFLRGYGFPVEAKPNQHRDVMLGSKDSPRHCSLCQRCAPAVTFRQEKHVIPESLGNRWLLTYNECDSCNQTTGKELENELGKMLIAERAVARTPAKTRTAKLKLSEGNYSSIGGQGRGEPLLVALHESDNKIELNFKNNASGGTLKMQTPSFKPIGALKSIAKSIWHLLSIDEQRLYDQLRRWIIGELSVYPCLLYQYFIPGPGLTDVGICAWEHRYKTGSTDFPPLVGMLYSGNTVLVFPLPNFGDAGIYKQIALPALPYSDYPDHYPVGFKSRILGDGKHKRQGQSFEIGFISTPMLVYTKAPIPVSIEYKVDEETFQCDAELYTPTENASEEKIEQLVYRIKSDNLGGEFEIINDVSTHSYSLGFKINYPQPAIDQMQNFLKVSYLAHRGAELTISHEQMNLPLFTFYAEADEEKAAMFLRSLFVAKTIELINNHCDVKLCYPEKPWEINFEKLIILVLGLQNGEYVVPAPKRVVSLVTNKADADSLVELLSTLDPTGQECVEVPFVFSLDLDTTNQGRLVLKPVYLQFPLTAKLHSRAFRESSDEVTVSIMCDSVKYIFRADASWEYLSKAR